MGMNLGLGTDTPSLISKKAVKALWLAVGRLDDANAMLSDSEFDIEGPFRTLAELTDSIRAYETDSGRKIEEAQLNLSENQIVALENVTSELQVILDRLKIGRRESKADHDSMPPPRAERFLEEGIALLREALDQKLND